MTESHDIHPAPHLDRAALPDLATAVGLAGRMRHVEVGGSACTDSGIAIATVAFFGGGR